MKTESFENATPVVIPGQPVAPARPEVRPRTRVAGLAAVVRSWLRDAVLRHRFGQEFHALNTLSDHHLRDIGMHRGEINPTRLRTLLADRANWGG